MANLGWLVNHAPVHVHADLIFGLPGEDLLARITSENLHGEIDTGSSVGAEAW